MLRMHFCLSRSKVGSTKFNISDFLSYTHFEGSMTEKSPVACTIRGCLTARPNALSVRHDGLIFKMFFNVLQSLLLRKYGKIFIPIVYINNFFDSSLHNLFVFP